MKFSNSGIVTFAEPVKPMSAAEVRARIAKLEKENAQMRAEQSTRQQRAISNLIDKLPQVAKSSPNELELNQKLDAAIQNSLGVWRGQAKNIHSLLKTPVGVEFTAEELDLAGWIHQYSEDVGISFVAAMEQIFDYLKRYPTKGGINFAESSDTAGISVSAPRGWSIDPQRMEIFRRARVFQAAHPDCDLAKAVRLVGGR